MQDKLAGIYFDDSKDGPAATYDSLPEASKARLGVLLRRLQASLRGAFDEVETVGQSEWEPGSTVYWRIVLRPTEYFWSPVRIEAYRIEVWHIATDD